MTKRILLISRMPPPIGGVSIHTYRLAENLKKSGYPVYVVEPTFANIFKIGFYAVVSEVIHIHSLNFFSKTWVFWALLRLFKKNVILTLHSHRRNLFLEKLVLRIPKHVISVNEQIKEQLSSKIGIKTHVVSPFLLPTQEERIFFAPLKETEMSFFQSREVISVNAWKVIWENGKDIYGLDLIMRAFALVQEKNSKAGLCLCIPQLTLEGKEYLEDLSNKYKINNSNVLVLNSGVSFFDILMRSSVFVRPTRTDGDALSVKEALLAGVPTIATNVVERPTGVILTELDYKCLAKKIIKAMNTKIISSRQVSRKKIQEEAERNMNEIINIYNT